MLWSILAIGVVGGFSTVIMVWLLNKFYTGSFSKIPQKNGPFINIFQAGGYYGKFFDDLEIASPRQHDDK